MIKNKWLWALCLAVSMAALVAYGTVAKKQTYSATELAKGANLLQESADVGSTGVALAIKPAKDPSARVNPYEGREAYQNPKGQAVSEFLAEHRSTTVNETSDLLPGMAEQIREESNSLDVLCNISQGSTNNSGFVNGSAGMEFAGWINPAPSCAGSPDFPYRIDSVRFSVANAAAFGITGAAGAGTAVYRVNIYGSSNCGADSCANPGNALCSSTLVSYTTLNTAGALATLTVPVNCCVNGPFFTSIEYVSWTGPGDNGGTGGAFRSLWPSLLWSNVTRPLCEQWVFNGCSWVDHSNFFSAPAAGFYNFIVYGESNTACTPITCSTEVVCDITCPGGSTPEGEPTCANEYVDVTNGGCFAVAENFTNMVCGQTYCGTSGTFTVGGVANSDDDFYRFTLTTTTDVTFCATAEFCVLIALFDAGPTGYECDSATVLDVVTEPSCSTACITMRLTPGTYYGYVSTALTSGVTCGTPYYASLQCVPVACQPDFTTSVNCNGATPAIAGSTVGANDPCAIGIESELWQLNVTAAGRYNFKGCEGPEAYDQYLYLFDAAGCCVAFSAEDDDLCGVTGGLSYIRCIDLTPGTYYLLVSGFGAGDVGQYAITVDCCQPCPIECVDNEAEGDCGTGFVGTNEGCNTDPVTFETISCGDTKCGSWGYYTRNDSSFRDLDWYKISLAQDTRVTATCVGELENSLFISTDCPSTIIEVNTAFECSTNTVSACLRAGDYYIISAPAQGLANAPCGSKYTLSVSCEPCDIIDTCPAEAAFGQAVDLPTDIWTFGVSDAIGDLKRFESFTLTEGMGIESISFWGITTASADFSVCEEEPMTFSIQVWSDLAGAPNIAAGPVCDITATLARTFSELVYNSVYNGYYWTYAWPEGTCCELLSGWISIQGISVGAPNNCRFLWGSSGGSTGGSSQLWTAGVRQTDPTFNLAMCINACPVPCDPVPHTVTVYRNAVGVVPNNFVTLRFTAPQAGTYLIYKSTNPNNDGDADGPDADALPGDDTDWALAGSPVLGPGDVSWDAPAGFDSYANYIVYHQCW